MNKPTIVIAGGGGVLARALAAEFASAGYEIVLVRRSTSRPTAAARYREVYCDLADAKATREAVARIATELGPIDTLVCNASHLVMAPFATLELAEFEEAWRVSVAGAMASAQAALPGMLGAGKGTLIFTGASASLRGNARFAAFASAKFALRGLAQALAREYQSQGIHVVHVVLDGLLRGSPSIQRFGGRESQAIDPADVARTYRWLAQQPPSAWTHELDMRPRTETF